MRLITLSNLLYQYIKQPIADSCFYIETKVINNSIFLMFLLLPYISPMIIKPIISLVEVCYF